MIFRHFAPFQGTDIDVKGASSVITAKYEREPTQCRVSCPEHKERTVTGTIGSGPSPTVEPAATTPVLWTQLSLPTDALKRSDGAVAHHPRIDQLLVSGGQTCSSSYERAVFVPRLAAGLQAGGTPVGQRAECATPRLMATSTCWASR